jgi:MoaA/NifB/PqqE/SkfB family radical SAM enzyme
MLIKRIINIAKNSPDYFVKYLRSFPKERLNIYFSNFSQKSFVLKKLWLVLTYKCNLRCKMCGQWGEKGRSKEFSPEFLSQELSYEEYKKIIDDVFKYSPKIMLMGGEPLLYKNWYDVAKYIKNKNLLLEITTNGILLKENSEKILIFDTVNISLDGPKEINDRIRGINGGFLKVLEGIKEIENLKRKRNLKKPYINLCCTISDQNYLHLTSLVEEIEEEEIEISLLLFQHLEFVNEKIFEENKIIWQQKFSKDSEYWSCLCHKRGNIYPEKLFSEITKIKKLKNKKIKFIMFEPDFEKHEIVSFYTDKELKKLKEKCLAPWQEVFIYPEGNIWTCPGLVMGNVKEEKLTDIWNGKNYQRLRKILNEIKFFPVCKSCANHWHNWSN